MNGMKAQILTATLLTAFSGALSAADPQLLNLVMPDAKVLAGVNVEQAKGTQFGQYVLNQLQTEDKHMQELVALTGFDPRRDVRELLVASNGVPEGKTGLALAKGNFDVAKITAAATLHGVTSEVYKGIAILSGPDKKEAGIAFLDAFTVAAGDIASVKGAIDRLSSPQSLPAAVAVKVNLWSTSQDAWGITTVAPASLNPHVTQQAKAGARAQNPGQNGMQNPMAAPMMNAAQNVQAAAAGVKFGAQVVFIAEAECDTAQNASTLGDVVKLLVNLAQMQASQDATAQALIKSVTVAASGNLLKVSASLPQDVFQNMLQPQKRMRAAR